MPKFSSIGWCSFQTPSNLPSSVSWGAGLFWASTHLNHSLDVCLSVENIGLAVCQSNWLCTSNLKPRQSLITQLLLCKSHTKLGFPLAIVHTTQNVAVVNE